MTVHASPELLQQHGNIGHELSDVLAPFAHLQRDKLPERLQPWADSLEASIQNDLETLGMKSLEELAQAVRDNRMSVLDAQPIELKIRRLLHAMETRGRTDPSAFAETLRIPIPDDLIYLGTLPTGDIVSQFSFTAPREIAIFDGVTGRIRTSMKEKSDDEFFYSIMGTSPSNEIIMLGREKKQEGFHPKHRLALWQPYTGDYHEEKPRRIPESQIEYDGHNSVYWMGQQFMGFWDLDVFDVSKRKWERRRLPALPQATFDLFYGVSFDGKLLVGPHDHMSFHLIDKHGIRRSFEDPYDSISMLPNGAIAIESNYDIYYWDWTTNKEKTYMLSAGNRGYHVTMLHPETNQPPMLVVADGDDNTSRVQVIDSSNGAVQWTRRFPPIDFPKIAISPINEIIVGTGGEIIVFSPKARR